MTFRTAVLLALACVLVSPAAAVAEMEARPTTKHVVTMDGKVVTYRAWWAEMPLDDASGQPQATISATSYLRQGVRDPANRPVLFLFNGGPGASSSPLHFGAFGPRRWYPAADGKGGRVLGANDRSLIDAADLVFIDPVGTGFSRELRDGGGKAYWSPSGDADAALFLIRTWLARNGRMASPLFIAGESYGGYRLAIMAANMADLNVKGLILISPSLEVGGGAFAAARDQDHVVQLPSLAVAAWANGKAAAGGTVDMVWATASDFAQNDYVRALQQGTLLPATERARIATRLAALTGLSVSAIEAANLRIDTQQFLETLLPGKIVGRLDSRIVAARPDKPLNPDRPAAANDPALGLGRSNVIMSDGIRAYLRDELKGPADRDYYSLTLDVNFQWNWNAGEKRPDEQHGVAGNIADLMARKPEVRLLVLGGYYDLAVPVLAPRYILSHADIPFERVETLLLPAGHSPFEGGDNLAKASAAVRGFLQTAVPK